MSVAHALPVNWDDVRVIDGVKYRYHNVARDEPGVPYQSDINFHAGTAAVFSIMKRVDLEDAVWWNEQAVELGIVFG